MAQRPSPHVDHEEPAPPLPLRRHQQDFTPNGDPEASVQYSREPHKLIAYLVPFPKPQLRGVDLSAVPIRFLIYTPPPPPLTKPREGDKEAKLRKVRRKWQEEVREANLSRAKTASWQGIKGKATKGIDWAMNRTTTSNLDFLNRMAPEPHLPAGRHQRSQSWTGPTRSSNEVEDTTNTTKTAALSELVLVYPSSMPGSQEQLRAEFIDSMLRSKTKAERDAVIATGLLPVSLAIDVLATVVWPFGGLLEIDSVWLYSSLRGAGIARRTTKRLTSTAAPGDAAEDKLKLTFVPSAQLETLRIYLAAKCHQGDGDMFPNPGQLPSESQVLEAIGWAPSQTDDGTQSTEDLQWEVVQVRTDLKRIVGKGAREWRQWCKAFEKQPEKALRR